ncbi:DUF805 domain-containing protein [Methylobacterium organophilum]|uniref:DUF805 domain-containing protein n=1 Tax=Methylobacterium organophilum TaxID=410 RepID=UPI001F131A63|nr:DUF805 domain-containing protein [Methylobacterium organophilum]UMY16237.1 DUF805 domain-containing protein [Methylobacterium organophilum]
MRGKILVVADATREGLISGQDGQRYSYRSSDLRSPASFSGQDVDFTCDGTEAREIYALETPLSTLTRRDWVPFYLSPKGRLSRGDYWLYGFLVPLIAGGVLGWIPILGQILAIVSTWSAIAVGIKRCHDLDRSGWWMFLPLLPLLFAAVSLAVDTTRPEGPVGGLTLLLASAWLATSLWLLVVVFLRRGQQGPNRFGPDPLARSH